MEQSKDNLTLILEACEEYLKIQNEDTLSAVENAISKKRYQEYEDEYQRRLSNMTEEKKHRKECHPDYEYTSTDALRKSGDSFPPDGAWMRNPYKRFERNDVYETEFWYRKKNPEPIYILYDDEFYKVPSREWAYILLWNDEDSYRPKSPFSYGDVDKIIYEADEIDSDSIIDLSHLSIDDHVRIPQA